MASKYADLWVSRDDDVGLGSEYVSLWTYQPEKNSLGCFDVPGIIGVTFSAKEFAKIAGWTPRKGRKYPVTIEIKRKGK